MKLDLTLDVNCPGQMAALSLFAGTLGKVAAQKQRPDIPSGGITEGTYPGGEEGGERMAVRKPETFGQMQGRKLEAQDATQAAVKSLIANAQAKNPALAKATVPRTPALEAAAALSKVLHDSEEVATDPGDTATPEVLAMRRKIDEEIAELREDIAAILSEDGSFNEAWSLNVDNPAALKDVYKDALKRSKKEATRQLRAANKAAKLAEEEAEADAQNAANEAVAPDEEVKAATPPAAAPGEITLVMVKEEMAKHMPEKKDLIKPKFQTYGVKKISDIPVEKYPEFLAFLKTL